MTIICFEDLLERDAPKRDLLLDEAKILPTLELTERQLCDLELILNGAFSPLQGFMTQKDVQKCCSDMRLASGDLFPLPVTLDIHEEDLVRFGLSEREKWENIAKLPRLALCQEAGRPLAILSVTEVFRMDKSAVAQAVFLTQREVHPGVENLLSSGPYSLGGSLEAIQLRERSTNDQSLCLTPSQLRANFAAAGFKRIVAFQTRNPMHRAHFELTKRAAASLDAHLLLHPVIGPTQPGDVPPLIRVAAYKVLLPRYPIHSVTLALLPLAMRMGGPREALLHAIIRRNYGATHFIIGRDHAGPAPDPLTGRLFYEPYDAQNLALQYQEELGITIVPFSMLSYVPSLDKYLPADEVPPNTPTMSISGTQLRQALRSNQPIPDWFSYPEVVAILRQAYTQDKSIE